MSVLTYPKIGIRPTIDGRENGVRESLEKQTMKMAINLKKYIEENYCYPDGTAVQVVIADNTIGRFKESSDCEEKFSSENVAASITVTPCWCYGIETMDLHPSRIKAVWGFNGTERPGAVFLNAVLSAHNQLGLPAFGIYGADVMDKDDESIPNDIKPKLDRFIKSSVAVGQMKNKSYLQLGGVSMGIAGSLVDYSFFQKYLGMNVVSVDMIEIMRRIDEEIFDPNEYELARKWVSEKCNEIPDINREDLKLNNLEIEKGLDYVTKMTMIIKDLMEGNEWLRVNGYNEEGLGNNAIVGGFQGQRQWTDYLPNGDFSETILNTSFDWNGPKLPNILATENDALNGVSMLFGHLLTNTAQIFCDVRTYWSPNAITSLGDFEIDDSLSSGMIHLINSGSAALDGTGKMRDENGNSIIKPYYEVNDEDIENCLKATKWPVANREYFRGGGFSTNFLTEGGMKFTMSRLNLVNGKPVLQIIEGESIEVSNELYNAINERTDPTWPSTFFKPKENTELSTYEVMNNWGANHCVLTYGHVGDLMITLASMLRIPVSLHNVEAERIFRPTMWSHYGTLDLTGSDFRSCDVLGPLYE